MDDPSTPPDPAARMRVLVQITRTFPEAVDDYGLLLRTIARETATLMGGHCVLSLTSDDGQWVEIAAEYAVDHSYLGEIRALLGPRRFPIDSPFPTAAVVRTGVPVLLTTLATSGPESPLSPELNELIARRQVRGLAAVPVRVRGATIGMLATWPFGPDAHVPNGEDVELLQVLADHAGLAISNARLIAAMRCELDEHQRTRGALERSEEKFRQAQKMEAVGRLAGGVAHDFNNILSVVLGYADLMLADLRPADPMREEVEEIRRAGQRAADLTRQLLAFSRKQILSPRVVSLNTVITSMERMLSRLLGEDLEVRYLLRPDLHLTRVDPGQIEQILMNLAVNARDAMPTGGQLTVETANVDLTDEYVAQHPEATVGPHACLSVSDTGTGMERAVQAHIFEPFYTTKPLGVGSGLGLSTVYGIVKQSGGTIWLYSEPGEGTTFKIYLPRANEGLVETSPAPPPSHKLTGTETVLVVEDEEQVRELVSGVLRRAGYHVIAAENGGEALLRCEQHGATIHLLLTDVVMPRMSGRQLAERLLQIRPDMKVLFMSGYTENAIVHHGVLDSGVHFLQKPITPDALLRQIRAVLQS